MPQPQIIATQPYYQTTQQLPTQTQAPSQQQLILQQQQLQQQLPQTQTQYIYQIAAPATSIPGQPTQTQFYTSSAGNVIPFATQGYPQFVSVQAPPLSSSSCTTFMPNNQSKTPMTQYIQLTPTNPTISGQILSSFSSSSPNGAATATMYTTA